MHVARTVSAFSVMLVLVVSVGASDAQTTGRPRRSNPPPAGPLGERFEISVGASWLGGYGLGSREATLIDNGVPTGGTLVLFRTDSDVTSSPALDVRLGYRLTHILFIEGSFALSHPELRTHISGDFEGAPSTVANDAISQYLFGGAVGARADRWAFAGRRATPFVIGGIGYLRQLAEDKLSIENGTAFYAGGGVYWLAARGRRRPFRELGARFDALVNWRSGGLDVDDSVRVWPSIGASLFVRF